MLTMNFPLKPKVLSRFFNWGKYNLVHDEYKELAIISSNDIETIKKEYDIIKNNYSGDAKDYINKINMIEKNHEIQLLRKDNEIQLLQKENEILHLKLLLASK